MKKLVYLICIVSSLAALTSCNDEPWEDYKWATTNDGLLYSTNKCMSEKEFKRKVVGHVWDCYSFWETIDLKNFGSQIFESDLDGGAEGGVYFKETECILFYRINPWQQVCTTAKWIYYIYPIERDPDTGIIRFDNYVLLGLNKGDLELCRTTLRSIEIDGEKIPHYYFELWGRKSGYDIDEIMAHAITYEELDRLYKEWLEQQHPDHE